MFESVLISNSADLVFYFICSISLASGHQVTVDIVPQNDFFSANSISHQTACTDKLSTMKK